MKELKSRIIGLWWLLTRKNFILMVPKEKLVGEQPGRSVEFIVRTDYSLDSDVLTVTALLNELREESLRRAAYQFIYTKTESDEIHP